MVNTIITFCIGIIGLLIATMNSILTFIIGIIAVYIAYQQYITNRYKVKFFLYDKRYNIYNGLKEFLITVGKKGNATDDDLRKFHIETNESNFLFDDDIIKYLSEVYQKACRLIKINNAFNDLENFPEGSEKRNKLGEKLKELMAWFSHQSDESIKKFNKYLNFKKY